MPALTIAIAALGLAGYAVFLTRKVRDALAELADAAEDEPEPDSAELWVSDGDLHTPDAAALYEATGALAIFMGEGIPQAVIADRGVFSLHKLLSESAKDAAKVRAIKP